MCTLRKNRIRFLYCATLFGILSYWVSLNSAGTRSWRIIFTSALLVLFLFSFESLIFFPLRIFTFVICKETNATYCLLLLKNFRLNNRNKKFSLLFKPNWNSSFLRSIFLQIAYRRLSILMIKKNSTWSLWNEKLHPIFQRLISKIKENAYVGKKPDLW